MPTKAKVIRSGRILQKTPNLIVAQLVLLLLILLASVPLCKADRFYCMRSGLIKIQVDYERRNEHHIVPEFDGSGDLPVGQSDKTNGDECTWRFYHVSKRATNIVLEGINRGVLGDVRLQKRSVQTGAVTTAAQVPYHLHYARIPSCASKHQSAFVYFNGNLTGQTVQVIPLQPGEELTITIQRHDYYKSPAALRITAVDEGYCTRLTTLHRNSCHHVTKASLTLAETAAVIKQSSGTAMQLASFDSLRDVLSFIDSNNPPDDEFPIKFPLDLTKPVRIGLFKTVNGQLKRMVTSGNKCALKALRNADEVMSQLSIGKSCVSLRVNDSGSPVIELVDCNQPMPALISFPEAPLNNSCLDCSSETLEWLNKNSQVFIDDKTPMWTSTIINPKSQSKSYKAGQIKPATIVIITLVVFVFIATVPLTALVLRCLGSSELGSWMSNSSNQDSINFVSYNLSRNTTLSRDGVYSHSNTLNRCHKDPLIHAAVSDPEGQNACREQIGNDTHVLVYEAPECSAT